MRWKEKRTKCVCATAVCVYVYMYMRACTLHLFKIIYLLFLHATEGTQILELNYKTIKC